MLQRCFQLPALGAGGCVWLAMSPAIRRWFVARGLPVPVRLPVELHGRAGEGLVWVRLPDALSQALGLPGSWVVVAEVQLRPCLNAMLWSAARQVLRDQYPTSSK